MNSYYSEEELEKIGFKSYGRDVLISRKASIYGAENISIGNNEHIKMFYLSNLDTLIPLCENISVTIQ